MSWRPLAIKPTNALWSVITLNGSEIPNTMIATSHQGIPIQWQNILTLLVIMILIHTELDKFDQSLFPSVSVHSPILHQSVLMHLWGAPVAMAYHRSAPLHLKWGGLWFSWRHLHVLIAIDSRHLSSVVVSELLSHGLKQGRMSLIDLPIPRNCNAVKSLGVGNLLIAPNLAGSGFMPWSVIICPANSNALP